jgi:DNA polymerase III sliding clamp (beta) subunit (PCNA family)/ribosomal protein S18 acetylase RimI-like enzyme
MKKDTITEEQAKKSPAGGVLVGKRQGQTIIHDKGTQGGYFVGKLHKEGGIKGINKSTGQPIEVQGGEVIITAPAVADQTKREFEGQMLTNREILSKINEKGGGVSLENGGEIYYNGSSYNYGGKTMTDYEIMQSMNDCGCDDEYDNGGEIKKSEQEENGKIEYFINKRKVGFLDYIFDEKDTISENLSSTFNNEMYIDYIEVDKEFRNLGIAKKLINKAIDIAKDKKIEVITLRRDSGMGSNYGSEYDNYLKNIYQKNGFQDFPDNEEEENTAMYYVFDKNKKFKNGGYVSYKDKYNRKFKYSKGTSHDLEEISKDTRVSIKGLQQIYNKGIGAYKTNPESVRPNVKSKEQWAMARVYSAVMGGKASKVDSNELKMNNGGQLNLVSDSKKGDHTSRDLNNYNDLMDVGVDSQVGAETGLFAIGGDVKPYDANMEGDSADTIFKEGGGVNVVIEDGWKVIRYSDGKEIYKKEDKNYSHEILRNKRGEVQLSTIVLDSLHGESFNKTYSETIFEYFDSVDDAKKYVKENYDTMDSKPEKKEVQTLSAEVFEWDKVPTNYRNISKVKKVPFTNNPIDKGLDSIISPFLGKDILRQSVMGVNFDENGITATNLHMLITLPYPNEKYNGIYDITGAKKQKSDKLLLINEKYPNYEAIIPKSENVGTPYKLHVYKLLQYSKTAINYANKTTRAIAFKFGDNYSIGFNSTLLTELLTASLKLGYEKLYAFITTSSRAMLLSPNKDYELGNDDILLLMPVMLMSDEKIYGAEDKDNNRSLRAYFDFNDNEIHNADGSVAEFKMQYQSNQLVDDNYLALLSKMIKKNRINILEYVKVENGKMTATDLEISLIVKDVNMPNGIYEIVNNAPNITMNPIEDFPSERVFNKGEYETHWEQKRPTAFEFVTFSEVFEFYLDKLLLSVGKDDLRPIMSGICIKKTAQNEMFLVTTDAHTLCKINITEFCEFNKDSRELEYVLPVKYLKDFVKLADGSLHFKCSMSNIFIEADNLDFIGRTIDGKYPNYDAVIPRDSTKKIVFDHVAMNKCLKSPEMTNLIAKYKGRKDITFDFFNIGNTLNIKVSQNKGYNVQSELIESIELCKIDFNYQEVESTLSLSKSAFLLMPSKDEFKENQYFSFRKEFFDVMLETITDTEVDCYFSEPNRAYVFPIDAIDYKKTLPVEKTKQQKLSKKDLEQIVELENMKEVLESNELQEAIETLEMLIQTAKGKDKKDIKEALEIIKMLNENN